MTRGYRASRAGMYALAQSAGVQQATVQVATRAGEWAERNAPVRTGTYRDSFRVEPVTVTVAGMPRAGARLVNTARHAWAVEWGRGARHTLARSVDHASGGVR